MDSNLRHSRSFSNPATPIGHRLHSSYSVLDAARRGDLRSPASAPYGQRRQVSDTSPDFRTLQDLPTPLGKSSTNANSDRSPSQNSVLRKMPSYGPAKGSLRNLFGMQQPASATPSSASSSKGQASAGKSGTSNAAPVTTPSISHGLVASPSEDGFNVRAAWGGGSGFHEAVPAKPFASSVSQQSSASSVFTGPLPGTRAHAPTVSHSESFTRGHLLSARSMSQMNVTGPAMRRGGVSASVRADPSVLSLASVASSTSSSNGEVGKGGLAIPAPAASTSESVLAYTRDTVVSMLKALSDADTVLDLMADETTLAHISLPAAVGDVKKHLAALRSILSVWQWCCM